jgi:pSer/pThr/pTyr-binding forkhead associated (FHA) protein
MALQLRVLSGRDSGRLFTLTEGKPFRVGRDMGTDTRLKDPQVAMLHCQVEAEPGRVVLTDLNSSGGTFVGPQRVREQELRLGDVFRVGDTRIRLEG